MRSMRGRRAASKRANAASWPGASRSDLASTTASSIDSEAPWPEVGEGAWAASPITIIRPRCHTGSRGMAWIGLIGISSVVARTSASAGPASPANSSSSRRRHSSSPIARSSPAAGSSRCGTLANHQTSPSGASAWPKNARRPKIIS